MYLRRALHLHSADAVKSAHSANAVRSAVTRMIAVKDGYVREPVPSTVYACACIPKNFRMLMQSHASAVRTITLKVFAAPIKRSPAVPMRIARTARRTGGAMSGAGNAWSVFRMPIVMENGRCAVQTISARSAWLPPIVQRD